MRCVDTISVPIPNCTSHIYEYSEEKYICDKIAIYKFHINSNIFIRIWYFFGSHLIFFSLAFWSLITYSSVSHTWRIICEREKKYIYEKSMIAIIIGMWTRFIHWQNKLTIDYFRNVAFHPFAYTHQQIIPFDFSAMKNENHSYGNQVLIL